MYLREELCTPGYCIALNPQWRFPVWESCVDKLVKILLCEGGDVELCARTSKHIRVFAIDPLTLTLSLFYIVPCINSYCHIILICLVVIVCVPHLCLTTRASYSTSTLIQKNQEELVQSPSPGIQLHSLVTRSVLLFRF